MSFHKSSRKTYFVTSSRIAITFYGFHFLLLCSYQKLYWIAPMSHIAQQPTTLFF